MTDSLCRKRKLADSFIPCDRRHNELVSKFNGGFKVLLQQGRSDPNFYLVYKLYIFLITMRDKRICYSKNVMWQSTCLEVYPVMDNNYTSLFKVVICG